MWQVAFAVACAAAAIRLSVDWQILHGPDEVAAAYQLGRLHGTLLLAVAAPIVLGAVLWLFKKSRPLTGWALVLLPACSATSAGSRRMEQMHSPRPNASATDTSSREKAISLRDTINDPSSTPEQRHGAIRQLQAIAEAPGAARGAMIVFCRARMELAVVEMDTALAAHLKPMAAGMTSREPTVLAERLVQLDGLEADLETASRKAERIEADGVACLRGFAIPDDAYFGRAEALRRRQIAARLATASTARRMTLELRKREPDSNALSALREEIQERVTAEQEAERAWQRRPER